MRSYVKLVVGTRSTPRKKASVIHALVVGGTVLGFCKGRGLGLFFNFRRRRTEEGLILEISGAFGGGGD